MVVSIIFSMTRVSNLFWSKKEYLIYFIHKFLFKTFEQVPCSSRRHEGQLNSSFKHTLGLQQAIVSILFLGIGRRDIWPTMCHCKLSSGFNQHLSSQAQRLGHYELTSITKVLISTILLMNYLLAFACFMSNTSCILLKSNELVQLYCIKT